MAQKNEARADEKNLSDVDEIVQLIAKIAEFRGVEFQADERKVKLYRTGGSNSGEKAVRESVPFVGHG